MCAEEKVVQSGEPTEKLGASPGRQKRRRRRYQRERHGIEGEKRGKETKGRFGEE